MDTLEYTVEQSHLSRHQEQEIQPDNKNKELQPCNFFTCIPVEIRNHIVEYVLYNEAIERIAKAKRSIRKYCAERSPLSFKKFALYTDSQGTLFFTRTQEKPCSNGALSLYSLCTKLTTSTKQLFTGEGSTYWGKVKSFGTIRALYTSQVICCNVSPNKKYAAFLVACYNNDTEDFYPEALHVIDLLHENNKKIVSLKPLISVPDSPWSANRVVLHAGDNVSREALVRKGYWIMGSRHNATYMHNNVLEIAIDNRGRTVAIADQTGIMTIAMETSSIKKIVDKNLFYYYINRSRYKMGFSYLGTDLYYSPWNSDDFVWGDISPDSNDLQCVSLKKDTSNVQDVNPVQDKLEAFFRTIGVCKKLYIQ